MINMNEPAEQSHHEKRKNRNIKVFEKPDEID